MFRVRLMAFVVLTLTLALAGVARAQPVPDVYKIDYFDNAGSFPDATVRITNPGTTFDASGLNGDLCAMIYVYRPDQQLAECCGCKVTPNGLLKLSVNNNLTNNPLTADPLRAGVIKIVSALPTKEQGPPGSSGQCDPGANSVPVATPALRAWATHVQDSGSLTETAFQDATLSPQEQVLNMVLKCLLIEGQIIPGLGSGHGLCSCTEEKSW